MLILLAQLGCAPASPCTGLDANGDGICEGDSVDWSQQAWVEPGTSRYNLYDLDPQDLAEVRERGWGHAMVWPVSVTGMRMPYEPLRELLENPDNSTVQGLTRQVAGFGSLDELYERLGLPPIPADLALPPGLSAGDPMGAAVVPTEHGDALVFSCAACHTSSLFGKTVLGMGNKQARPNAFFSMASEVLPTVPPQAFQNISGATDGEIILYSELLESIASVGTRDPQVLGLDTSLAQVSLSLSKRGQDPYAQFDEQLKYTPRESVLDELVADSKPTPWWTLQYKTAWLADGSIVQGNPILTNFLWNELGRGTDLERLEGWLADNQQVVDELTVAVFATSAPQWSEWFGEQGIDIALAKQGQQLFEARCAGCHGSYEKAWDSDPGLAPTDAMVTTAVYYHGQTPRFDVGTDPGRAQGMMALEPLNELAISQAMETVVLAGQGYVPPPLTGIWARYPYLHNNAAPTLCELLTPADERTSWYWQGPAVDPDTDFDSDCVGYPLGERIPESWTLVPDAYFDTTLPGLSNAGHESMLYDADGSLAVGPEERAALVMFLKTL